MRSERLFNGVNFEPLAALGNFFHNFSGQIFSAQQDAYIRFANCGIIQNRQQHFAGFVVQQRRQFLRRRYGRALDFACPCSRGLDQFIRRRVFCLFVHANLFPFPPSPRISSAISAAACAGKIGSNPIFPSGAACCKRRSSK